jgi:hypothetical protein
MKDQLHQREAADVAGLAREDLLESLYRLDDAIRSIGQELAKAGSQPEAMNVAWRELNSCRNELETSIRKS